MGIWMPSPMSQKIASSHSGLLSEYRKALPDFHERDIIGSPYAIYDYEPNPLLCDGWDELKAFRDKIHSYGKKLVLDFVPNHMACDTKYLETHPECFLKASELIKEHDKFLYNNTFFAHGKDPYFDGWSDTVQFDFSHPNTIQLHQSFLEKISECADIVRCDMAMLPLHSVFLKTHGKNALPYWEILIPALNKKNLIFWGEVYWNLEYDLQTIGFEGTYDKILYDRFKSKNTEEIIGHLSADLGFQEKSIRFLENHDEPRAFAVFGEESISLFALLSFLPGKILYYEGQEVGKKLKQPVQLGREHKEENILSVSIAYDRMFKRVNNRKGKSLFLKKHAYSSYDESPSKMHIVSISTQDHDFFEIMIFNPNHKWISGRVLLSEENIRNLSDVKMIHDLVSGQEFEFKFQETIQQGLYFHLKPFSTQWLKVR